jgi:hypothetical protein
MKLASIVLVACASRGETTLLSVATPAPYDPFDLRVGHAYDGIWIAKVGSCRIEDGTESKWTIADMHVASGELPPGLMLEDGSLSGSPTTAGTYKADLVFTGIRCAGRPIHDYRVELTINVR